MVIPKSPFVQVTNTTNFAKINSATPTSVNGFTDEPNKFAIIGQQNMADRNKRKRVEDRKNIEPYKIARLDMSEYETESILNEKVVKQESGSHQPSAIIRSSSTPQVDRKPQPFPLTMDIDYKPLVKREEPSGSSSAILQHYNAKPTIQPITSGSNPSMSEPNEHGPMDVDDDSGYDSDFNGYAGMPAIANEVIDKIGIKMPSAIIDDAHDSNGDYHGRGHDIFVGPQAKADECVPAQRFNINS